MVAPQQAKSEIPVTALSRSIGTKEQHSPACTSDIEDSSSPGWLRQDDEASVIIAVKELEERS
jgi:hypothetical protein